MRISHLIIVVLGLLACIICYFFGFRAGTKESPLREAQQHRLSIALHTYQAAENTNWTKVYSDLSIVLLALTRTYEAKYGVPKGTNEFVQTFAEAKAAADEIEKHCVPLSSAFTNLPVSPNFKVGVSRE